MDAPQYPTPPDPKETAAAQAAANKETAVAQYGLAATNQNTPTGSLNYKQIGTWEDGTPRFESTTTLSPEQQNIFNLNQQSQGNLANIGVQQSGKIGDILNTPFDINAGRGQELADINKTFLDPQWSQNEEALNTKLINQGIRPGTEAYDRATRNFGQQKDDAYNSMYLGAYDKANNAALTERNQPINEITALMSGSQVQQPNFSSTPTPGVAPTDVIGATNTAYQGQVGAYNAELQNQRGLMSGLFGLGSSALGGWALSDERTKEDVEHVGVMNDGTNIYQYNYIGDDEKHVGVMAQEVERTHPNAVAETPEGVKMVNYKRLVAELTHG